MFYGVSNYEGYIMQNPVYTDMYIYIYIYIKKERKIKRRTHPHLLGVVRARPPTGAKLVGSTS